MLVEYFQLLGKKTSQEDAYFISKDQRLIVVCDGVGGHATGDVASRTIVQSLAKQYEDACQKSSLIDVSAMLNLAIESLNNLAECSPNLSGSSTTIALVYFDHDKINVTHIGDSRVIMLRDNNEEIWATKDHSIVQELFDAGILKTHEQMRKHPYSNRITKAITAGKVFSEDIEIQKIPLMNSGDYLIICSDGLLENYTNQDLHTIHRTNGSKEFGNIIKSQCEKSSKDNTTVIMVSH